MKEICAYFKVNCGILLFGLGGAIAYGYGIDLEASASESNPTPNAYHPLIATVGSLRTKVV